ncbi:sensor histidine kinase [Paenibacillus psychroresistens]|uniref:histidine kinase n=1 Tax=Paenibacillus psychroresistens TaxID=1778678 RepID=A0A6B8RU55_9BACL|nr:sensor histidine kinase [Paenibacillus psychroresistens]
MFKPKVRSQEGPPFYLAFIWLVYMIYPVASLVGRPVNEMIPGFLLVVFFSVIYIFSFFNAKRRILSILLQILIVGFFVFRYDENFLYMAFYPSPLIGMLKSRKQIVGSIIALLTLFAFTSWKYEMFTNTIELIQLIPAMLVMLGMPFIIRAGQRSNELKRKLNLANEEIAHLSKNEERQRISRDLHDTLGHTLSLITLKSELAEKLMIKNPERAAQEVKDIQTTSRAALKQLRELVSGMNAVTVRDEITHAKQILAAAGIVLEVKGDMDNGVMTPLVDNIMGMCLREAVTNVVKHSKASGCAIEWKGEAGSYILKVMDKGSGVDVDSCNGDVSKNGLNGMRERLKLVDGELQFESVIDQGTTVTFKVPNVNRAIEAGR